MSAASAPAAEVTPRNGTKSMQNRVRSENLSKAPMNASDGSVNYRGEPADTRKTGGWRAAPLIFGTEMCERLATAAIALNLEPYLVGDMHLSISRSSNIVTNFLGTSYLFCLLGGFIADAYLGRFRTLAGAAAIQFLGMCVLTLSATLPPLKPPTCTLLPCREAHGLELLALFLGLYLIALGTGGIKSCVSSFGADQFDDTIPEERKKKDHYFNWFFFIISLGTLLAASLFVYIQVSMGRAWAFGFSAGTMVVAMIGLWAGVTLYRYHEVQGSPFTTIAQVMVAATRNSRRPFPSNPNLLFGAEVEQARPWSARIEHTKTLRFLDKAAIPGNTASQEKSGNVSPWKVCTVTQVEEVKQLVRMLPIWATTSLCYTTYAQMLTFSVQQGQTLSRNLGPHFTIPPASLGALLSLGVMASVTFYDLAFVPIARRFTGLEKGITSLQRIGLGLLFSALAMVAAALVETTRIHRARSHLGPSIPMSVFWLVPQYLLVAASEAFTYVGQLDFFYNEAPYGMRSMATGLCLSTVSVGFFTSSFLVETVNKYTSSDSHPGWLEGNFNETFKLYKFYWILAIISLANTIAFVLCAMWYVYKQVAQTDAVHTNYDSESKGKSWATERNESDALSMSQEHQSP